MLDILRRIVGNVQSCPVGPAGLQLITQSASCVIALGKLKSQLAMYASLVKTKCAYLGELDAQLDGEGFRV